MSQTQSAGCDGCEISAGVDPAGEGWVTLIVRERVSWWPYGIRSGLPEFIPAGARFIFCGTCAPLMAAGRYRQVAQRVRQFAELMEATGGHMNAEVRAGLNEHTATLRRVGLNSDTKPWGAA